MVLQVTHDRYFLDNVAGWILEVDKGQCMPYQGNYTAWLEHKASRMNKEDAQEQVRYLGITPHPSPLTLTLPDAGGLPHR